MNTKAYKIVLEQYNNSLKKFKDNINNIIKELKKEDLEENKKEKFLKELEILFSRKKDS